MKTRFRACFVDNAFAGETMARVSIDIELPVGSGRAHFVSKGGQLLVPESPTALRLVICFSFDQVSIVTFDCN